MLDVTLPAFLPADRRAALARHRTLPERSHGAVLYADISGFTALSRRLSEEFGLRRGVDVLSDVLEEVYEGVVTAIHQRAGAVIGFSGDAVSCWFDDTPDGLADSGSTARTVTGTTTGTGGAHRAMATALSLPQVLAGVTPVRLRGADADRPLAVKVAVAAGSVSRLLVGSPDVHTFEVLGGSLLSRTTDLEQVAQPGDVVTDAGTMALLGEAGAAVTVVDRRPTMSGEALVVTGALPLAITPWADTLSIDPAESAPWVDFRLRSRPTVLTELRPTVAMFLNFSPPDFDADLGAGERLDAFVRWVQDQVTPVDGIVIQVTLGEKSGFLYVAFGAPVAHEDLASRALGSALSLVRPPGLLAAMGPVRIGLAGGIARAGVYGSRQTLTYGVLGDRVNLAARLMAAAGPDEILLTKELAAEAGPAYRTEGRPPVLAKGFEGEVAVAALNGRLGYLPPATAHDRPLVGRDLELAAIGEVVTRLGSGTGGIIVVRGEVGVGKGHLLARARHLEEVPGGVRWLITEVREMKSTPLDAFASLVADLTFQSLGQTEDDRRQLFDTIVDGVVAEAAAVGGDGPVLAADLSADRPFLGALVGLVWPGSDYEHYDRRRRDERLAGAVATLVACLSLVRPVVVQVIGAEHLGSDAMQVVMHLGRLTRDRAVGLLLEERLDGPGAPGLAGGLESADLVLTLGPLDRPGVVALVAELLGDVPDERLVDLLLERCRGEPLFIEQLLADLIDRQALGRLADGRWYLESDDPTELPASLAGLLLARLDRLPTVAGDLVLLAAVLGLECARSDLAALANGVASDPDVVTGTDPDHDAAVEVVIAAGFLDEQPDRPGRLRFRHGLVRDAAYETQPIARLIELHAAAADVLAEAGAPPAMVADHLERAGRNAEAVTYLQAAATESRRLASPAETRRLLERAYRLDEGPAGSATRSAELLEEIAECAMAMGDYQGAAAGARVALAGTLEPAERLGLLCLAGEALGRAGRLDDAEVAFEEGVGLLRKLADPALAGRVYAGLALVTAGRGDLEGARDLAEVSAGFARSDPDPAAAGWAAHRLGVLALQTGHLEEAEAYIDTEDARFSELDQIDGRAGASNSRGMLHLARHLPEQAAEELARSVTLFERVGNEHGLACALDNLGTCLHRAGDEDGALRCLERAVAILARIGLGRDEVFATMWRAGTW